MTVTITVNGEVREVEPGMTVRGLLDSLDIAPPTVVVELNGRVLRGPQFDGAAIGGGDEVEIVHFVGGG